MLINIQTMLITIMGGGGEGLNIGTTRVVQIYNSSRLDGIITFLYYYSSVDHR